MKRILILFTFLLCASFASKAQKTLNLLIKEVIKYNTLLKEDKVATSDYLIKVNDSLDSFFMDYNGFLPHDSLLNLLEPYREIAMRNENQFSINKAHYYYFLATNADIRGKGGQAIYYAEKAVQEKAKRVFLVSD